MTVWNAVLASLGDYLEDILTWDNFGHIIGGAFIGWIAYQNSWLATGGVLLILGYLREGAQHRDEGAWIGWITPRRLTEAFTWGLGGGLAHLLLDTL